LIFEEGCGKCDAFVLGYGCEFAKLLHHEDPAFQGFVFSPCEWSQVVRSGVWFSWGWAGSNLGLLLGDGGILVCDGGVLLVDDGVLLVHSVLQVQHLLL
jgi:hypothetical protein